MAGAVGVELGLSATDATFAYLGDEGPGCWGELDPEWTACSGQHVDARQSPVDLRNAVADPTLAQLALQTFPTTVDIFNNGFLIEQRYADTGSSIEFDGQVFELIQFHFHSLSEHAVNGRLGGLELHAVHVDPNTGEILVIGQIFRVGSQSNDFLQTLIDVGLPEKNGVEVQSEAVIDLADAFGSTRTYFTYPGSLTTPPCSEIVTWVVLRRPVSITNDQLEAFRSLLGNDFRPLQDLNGRTIRVTG